MHLILKHFEPLIVLSEFAEVKVTLKTYCATHTPSRGIITGKRVMNFSDTTHECPCVEQMLTMHCSLAGPRAAIPYLPWPDRHEMKIIPTVETG